MALRNAAADYFSKLNPIASRIYTDLQETKNSYEDLWNKLSTAEQEQILTESIIKPEVSVKYSVPQTTQNNEDYAVKIVVDDHCSYRDEHSGPFSFRTKSQRNLTVFHGEQPKTKPTKTSENLVKSRTKPIPKLAPNVPSYAQDVDLNDISYVPRNDDDGLSSNSSTLPKTGLDFLDNW
ncbi:unnamed protein product [Ceutorhynchus assimilis]|uniref:DUF4706 domain-containing protein n=1 Tax=Ceutorhynchus assimilis TaxID=467358 RepID=A0A9N9MRQ9_9CUCU|nr:unnamed protein product [Ceutorhynchus assimilis]